MNAGALPQLPPAGLERRALGWAIDGCFIAVAWIPGLLLVRALWGIGADDADLAIFFAVGLPTFLAALAVLAVLEGGPRMAGPGKRTLRLAIVDQESGDAIGFKRAFMRRALSFLDVIPFAIGWLWALFDRRRQTWHDKAAGSVVVELLA